MKWLILAVVVLMTSWAAAQFEPDSLQARDSLITEPSSLELLADTSGILPDSAVGGSIVQRWLEPMGVILIACTTILLLYTVRSK